MIAAVLWPFRAVHWLLWRILATLGHRLAWLFILAFIFWMVEWQGADKVEGLFIFAFLFVLSRLCALLAVAIAPPERALAVVPRGPKTVKPRRAVVAVKRPSRWASPRERAMLQRLPVHLLELYV